MSTSVRRLATELGVCFNAATAFFAIPLFLQPDGGQDAAHLLQFIALAQLVPTATFLRVGRGGSRLPIRRSWKDAYWTCLACLALLWLARLAYAQWIADLLATRPFWVKLGVAGMVLGL